ncbi:hypothetical protein PRK78_006661 [Emydomyces testavorans]|uniref:Pinin/SDK/MemA protein domain-containing protein n=1 Tax=Emydomyces testavorans TaxID=2070801 RepID=A0AAF0DLS2_9EURO|nr:hypothetical protein PRK78_006661 [Emydomyces testavorans]
MPKSRSIASAVAIPDPSPASPEAALKRRQSPSDENSNNKRRRLSVVDAYPRAVSPNAGRTSTDDRAADSKGGSRRKSGPDEERKRGQRLFGALLGTLSQSPSTATQKRRADIERKQQAKLKKQDEEYDEQSKRQRDELMAQRKKEQRLNVRHLNMRATAHFLKTKSKPVLYYKPWQLRPEEESLIRTQIEEVEATIVRETEQFDRQDLLTEKEQESTGVPPAVESINTGDRMKSSANNVLKPDTVGADTNSLEKPSEAQEHNTIKDHISIPLERNEDTSHSKLNEDDSGDVILEDKEDTVIY